MRPSFGRVAPVGLSALVLVGLLVATVHAGRAVARARPAQRAGAAGASESNEAAAGRDVARVGSVGPLAALREDDLSAWCLERNDALVIPDSVLARPLSAPGRFFWPVGEGRTAANRNSNPLNIKLGSETKWHVVVGLASVSDIVPLDGGRFLRFDSPEAGFRAALALLAAPGYRELALDRALRKWSNNGYGAEIVTGTQLDGRTLVSGLAAADLEVLLAAMAAAEGYRSSSVRREIQKALGL